MIREFQFNGVDIRFPVRRAFSSCADEIEEKYPELDKLHFSLHEDSNKKGKYLIDLRVVSQTSDFISVVKTSNLIHGLKSLRSTTVNKLRREKKKRISKIRKRQLNKQLQLDIDNHGYQKAL